VLIQITATRSEIRFESARVVRAGELARRCEG
jgi:hypothetical protein